jgi:vancomycin permeability regulator SanA
MKNLWLHGFYLTVIGVLGFQLWAKTASTKRVFEQVDKVLTTNCEIIKGTSESLFYQIERNYYTNTKLFEQTFANAKAVKNATKSADNVLSNELSNLKDGKPNLNKIVTT